MNQIVLSDKLEIMLKECETSPWDFGNSVLYNLCRDNFEHKDTGKILSKVWLIGRSYAAAIERGVKMEKINGNFYIDIVAPKFKNSKIDYHLKELKQQKDLTIDNLPIVLEAHGFLTELTDSITNLEKRSFCSKYLHFHLPDLFFIYDSRVVKSLRQFIKTVPKPMKELLSLDHVDKKYATFVCKSFELLTEIQEKYNIKLTLRQFDNLLISIANEN